MKNKIPRISYFVCAIIISTNDSRKLNKNLEGRRILIVRRIDHAVFTTFGSFENEERGIFIHTHTHTRTSAVYIQPALLSNPISMVKHASALDAKLSFALPLCFKRSPRFVRKIDRVKLRARSYNLFKSLL